MKKIVLTLLAIIVFQNSFACLNGDTKELTNGFVLYQHSEYEEVPYGHDFLIDSYKELYKELDNLYKKANNIAYLSDKGYVLIVQGKYRQAVELYLKIEKLDSNRYSTASNLGTAYELLGQNENALKWIKKSVQINEESHNHSEWLHVKILEAKINGQKFITDQFLLGTSFGLEAEPKTKLSKKELLKLEKALFYQLNERISFVKPKDKIVARLLFELGNINFLLGNLKNAKKNYEQAQKYGFSDSILDLRTEQTDKIVVKIEKNNIQHLHGICRKRRN
ncbi:MAG: hypothetical protein EAZ97_12220 [Bacteroidetes bacterium]|nr:MAG: hypothetical protein EAZ97_12220 [Bacteroidota bacterium]